MDFIVVQASSTPTSPHLPGLPFSLSQPPAQSLLMPQPQSKSMSSSSPRHECALLPRRSSSVCAPVCVRVSVYAFILIYYGHGFFGTKICLLYKKRKQRQANKKSRTTVRGRGPSGPVPESRCHCQNREQTPSTLTHTHAHSRADTHRHTLSYKTRTAEGIAAADLEI